MMEKSSSILLISSEFPPGPGGIGHHAYSLTNALVHSGFKVTVMSPADYTDPITVSTFDQAQDFSIIRYPRIGWRTYFNRLHITRRYLHNQPIDTVILTGKFALWTGAYLKLRHPGILTLAILHGSEVNLPNRWLRMLTHRSIAMADVIVAVSGFTRSLLPDSIRKKRSVHIIPNGIETKKLATYPKDKTIDLQGYPALLTVGHVSPRKGQHRVIRALPAILQRYPEAHYHMVGRPIQQTFLTELAHQLGVEQHITFHGVAPKHTDLAAYYRGADLFMLLSENQPNGDVEGFGIVALEANYFGLPVIGAKYCGVEDAIGEGRSGFLVDGNKEEMITEAIEQSLEQLPSLQVGSRSWANQHDWNTIIPSFIPLLK